MPAVWVWGYHVPPLVVPVVLAYAVVAVVWVWRGRSRPVPTLERVLLVGAVLVLLAVTVSQPAHLDYPELFGSGQRRCLFYKPQMTWSAIVGNDQRLLNVLMLVPVGLLAPLVAVRLRRLAGVAVAVGVALLPALVEGIQWGFPRLQRACDADDLADNYLGLLLGLGASLLVLGLQAAIGGQRGTKLE